MRYWSFNRMLKTKSCTPCQCNSLCTLCFSDFQEAGPTLNANVLFSYKQCNSLFCVQRNIKTIAKECIVIAPTETSIRSSRQYTHDLVCGRADRDPTQHEVHSCLAVILCYITSTFCCTCYTYGKAPKAQRFGRFQQWACGS